MPLLLSVAFQQLYQMADSMIVGRFAESAQAGELALAAVGASYPITQLFVAVATGINIGTSVLVSQLFGAKRYLRMKTAISTALITTTVVSLLLTLFGAVCTNGLMSALNTSADIFADASLYLRVYVFGLLFLFIYNVCTGIFNAMGDSRTPLILLVISSVGNVILDIVFVAMLHWGVAGVAWATFIAQGASGVSTYSTFLAGAILVMVALVIVLNLVRSRTGRAIMAVRDNKIAAESVGISVTQYRMIAFVVSAALAGAAGALFGGNFSQLSATKFDFNTSILILVFVVLGGLGNMRGSVIAAALLTVLPELLRQFSDYRMLIYAIVLILVMIFTNNPQLKAFFARIKDRFASKKEVAADAQ